MDRLLQLEDFAKTAELGSHSKAAETLRMSNAAASRHLSALEERLAVRLIERNTHPQWLTEVGQELRQRCSKLLNELAEAEGAVSDRAVAEGYAACHELAIVRDDLSGADAARIPRAVSKTQRADHHRQPLSRFHRGRHRRRDPREGARARLQRRRPPHRRCGVCWRRHLPISHDRAGRSTPQISPVTTC
jgi:molybdenum-dependent DNA-binding transcriptional regulator ModE